MSLFHFKHIANRFLFWILGTCLLIFFGFSTLLYRQASALLRLQSQARAELEVSLIVQDIEALLLGTSNNVRTARSSLLNTGTHIHQLESLLRELVQDNAAIYGMALALEPDIAVGRDRFAPYAYRTGDGIQVMDLSEAYDYRQRPWYREAIDQGRSTWSEPYFDRGAGNIPMVTYSSPVITGNGSSISRFLGVITADISLQTLDELVSMSALGLAQGYVFIVSAGGRIITHPHPQLRMVEMHQLPGWSEGDARLKSLLQAAERQQRGQITVPCLEQPERQCWLSYQPLKNSNWSIVARVPVEELEASARDWRQWIIAGFTASCGLLILLILTLSRMLSEPIKTLATHTRHIARGDINKPMPPLQLQDEIGMLAHDIGAMQADLQEHITQLTEVTSRRQRMQTELAIAARIQAQMLPDGGHSRLQLGTIELVASTRPARQVGGDLYLYQILARQQLFFFIGDVSDKGVPAALFMAQCAAQIRELLGNTQTPAQLLAGLNRRLLINNDNCMFVTATAGVIDIDDGGCCLASAGHPPPLLLNPASDEPLCRPQLEAGPALGLVSDARYEQESLFLQPGATLLLYTDGADEAADPSGIQLGHEGLALLAESRQKKCADSLVEDLMRDIMDYQHGHAFDDMTLVTISNHRPA